MIQVYYRYDRHAYRICAARHEGEAAAMVGGIHKAAGQQDVWLCPAQALKVRDDFGISALRCVYMAACEALHWCQVVVDQLWCAIATRATPRHAVLHIQSVAGSSSSA